LCLQVAPVKLLVPNKLVYSPHVYGPDVFAQPYFNDPTFPDNMPEVRQETSAAVRLIARLS
jgi:endoglucanase